MKYLTIYFYKIFEYDLANSILQDGNEPIKIDINKDPYQYTGESNQFSVKANHLKKILDELDDKVK